MTDDIITIEQKVVETIEVFVPGPQGAKGDQGDPGADGQGVPAGGAAKQFLEKIDGTDFNTRWQYRSREAVFVMPSPAIVDTNGGWQKRTLAGNETLTFSLAIGASIYVTVVAGANTLDLSNVDEWVGGSAPATIEAEHAFVFWSDDGVTITGSSLGGIS
jgi:hypothetical protein